MNNPQSEHNNGLSDEAFSLMKQHAEEHPPTLDVSDQDLGLGFLMPADFDAQLRAIRALLRQHEKVDHELTEEIRQLKESARTGIATERLVDDWIDHLQRSTYQAAAHSMAAVGVIAPLVESIFDWTFRNIREQVVEMNSSLSGYSGVSGHPRWQGPSKYEWDYHYVLENGKARRDVVEGICQLAEALDITAHLPRNIKPILFALFRYRNKMFHCGLEWPPRERDKFADQIQQSNWPAKWFDRAETDGEPWIFYMSPEFVKTCLEAVDEIIEGIGRFLNELN